MRDPSRSRVSGHLRSPCHNEAQEAKAALSYGPISETPCYEDWNDQHQIGREPVVVGRRSPSADNAISPGAAPRDKVLESEHGQCEAAHDHCPYDILNKCATTGMAEDEHGPIECENLYHQL